jgi:lipopolysaccharide biosynthesis glycosyltransferase
MVVSLAFDRGYLPWAGTLVESLLRHHPRGALRLVVVHDGSLQTADCDRLRRAAAGRPAGLEFHAVEASRLRPLPTTSDFGPVVWLRLLLPELLAGEPRVLYLDADTFACGPLGDLWTEPLDGRPLAAVPNVVEPGTRAHLARLGFDYPGGVLNSGVLLMDLDRMREEGAVEEMFSYAVAERDRLLWPDQDVLNAVFRRRWKVLHPRWNAQNSLWSWPAWSEEVHGAHAVAEARSDPRIRHFEGPSLAKPWHYLCPFPGRDEYRRTLAATPWAGTSLVDRTSATRLISRLPSQRWIGAYLRLQALRRAGRALRIRPGER